MLSQCCFNYGFLLITRLKIALKFPILSESSDSSCPLKASSCLHIKLVTSTKILKTSRFFLTSSLYFIFCNLLCSFNSSDILKTWFERLFNDRCACKWSLEDACLTKALDKFFKSSKPSADHTVFFVLSNKQGQQNNFDFSPLPHSHLCWSYMTTEKIYCGLYTFLK